MRLAGHVVMLTLALSSARGASTAPAVRGLFQKHCTECHKPGSKRGGFGSILDRDELLRKEIVLVNEPEKSPLIEALRTSMPEGKPLLSREDQELVLAWIKEGAPRLTPGAPRAQGNAEEAPRFVSEEEVIRHILADLSNSREEDARHFRYLTLTHLHNAGLGSELAAHGLALAKLLNSLSWNKELFPVTAVDPLRSLYRFDLRQPRTQNNRSWKERDLWEQIALKNPFPITAKAESLERVRKLTGTRVPFLRGDWFASVVSQPPLYESILELPQGARAEQRLEQALGIDALAAIQAREVKRAGFRRSGVSTKNRIIERHPLARGYYWKSYDFETDSGRQNILASPLGPCIDDEALAKRFPRLFRCDDPRGKHFVHSGGEIIFSLPNGLQGYLLVNQRGGSIPKGPTTIVTDPRRRNDSHQVVNGLSCFRCHAAGIIPKRDDVAARFTDPEVLALYVPDRELNILVDKDRTQFREALGKLGIASTSETNDAFRESDTVENVFSLVERFEDELTFSHVAAELGLPAVELAARLRQAPALQKRLGFTVDGKGTLSREGFLALFDDAVKTLSSREIGREDGNRDEEKRQQLELEGQMNRLETAKAAMKAARQKIDKKESNEKDVDRAFQELLAQIERIGSDFDFENGARNDEVRARRAKTHPINRPLFQLEDRFVETIKSARTLQRAFEKNLALDTALGVPANEALLKKLPPLVAEAESIVKKYHQLTRR